MSQLPQAQAAHQASEDARLELSVAAAAAERRNRPLALVLVAGLALVIAAIYAVRAASSLAAARGEISLEQGTTRDIDFAATQIRHLSEGERAEIQQPDTGVGTKLTTLAGASGLPTAAPRFTLTQGDMPGSSAGANRKKYSVTIKDAPSQALLAWLVQATTSNDVGLTGLEVNSIKVRPAPGPGAGVGWDAEIILTRLERGG